MSGPRVLCRCSLELPGLDPFAIGQKRREELAVINVRGGCFYFPVPLTSPSASGMFPRDTPSQLKCLALFAEGDGDGRDDPVVIGDLGARFLKLAEDRRFPGLVLRFVDLSESQLDLPDGLPARFPIVEGPEQESIPAHRLARP